MVKLGDYGKICAGFLYFRPFDFGKQIVFAGIKFLTGGMAGSFKFNAFEIRTEELHCTMLRKGDTKMW
jgi:hypothetical protein